MAKTNEFDSLPCPHCGKKGLRWDFAAGQPRCPNCHLSGFPTESQPKQLPANSGEKANKPKPTTNNEIERDAKAANLSETVTETYTRERPNGEHEQVTVTRTVPVVPVDKQPDLTINYSEALFHKWRLAALLDQERRWGRDDLRKRGFTKIGRRYFPSTNKTIGVFARPGEETAEGTGQYALGQAIAVVRRAEQKLRNRDKSEGRDDYRSEE